MFKKIHSNRDPKTTIYSELKKEFSPYFNSFGEKTNIILTNYPKQIFGVMVGLILISFILSFTIFNGDGKNKASRREVLKKANITPSKLIAPPNDGLNSIIETTGKLKETIRLKEQINTIIAKQQLTKEDSTVLEQALNQLQQINTQINPPKL